MKTPWKDILRDYLEEPLPIKLVDAHQCDCSKADLKDFGFCLCGAEITPSATAAPKLRITIHEDSSGSMDHELFREFLELIGEIPKKS